MSIDGGSLHALTCLYVPLGPVGKPDPASSYMTFECWVSSPRPSRLALILRLEEL